LKELILQEDTITVERDVILIYVLNVPKLQIKSHILILR